MKTDNKKKMFELLGIISNVPNNRIKSINITENGTKKNSYVLLLNGMPEVVGTAKEIYFYLKGMREIILSNF